MSIITKYNNLTNANLFRGQVRQMIKEAKQEGVIEIVDKLTALLRQFPSEKEFEINVVNKVYQASNTELNGLDYFEFSESDSLDGVEPDDIYQYITDLILDLIKKDGGLKWNKPWTSTMLAARNYDSNQIYRGINAILLNYIYPQIRNRVWNNPYFLTFKQVDKYKGKIKKGAKACRVVYFTRLYKYENADEKINIRTYNYHKFITELKKANPKILKEMSAELVASQSIIPILKYYNVFNFEDVEGVKDKLPEISKEQTFLEFNKNDIAEAILELMPKRPDILHGGDQAYYSPRKDYVQMPNKETFESSERYYSTLFHELIHSTGHKNRVGREMKGKFGSKAYAFEELIAELGSSFLCGETNILNDHLKRNSAAYIKGWAKSLTKNLKEDNRFFFRAASGAQKAADFILERSKEGVPKYRNNLKNDSTRLKDKKEKTTTKKKPSKAQESKPKSLAKSKPKPKVKPRPKKQKVEQLSLFGIKKKNFSLNGFEKASEIPEQPLGVFTLPNSIGKFIQDIQAHQALILIKGTKHTSKSQLAMQLANAFAGLNLNVAYLDYEQGGIESKDTQNSIKWNLQPQNKERVFIKGYVENPMEELKAIAESANVLIADSVTDLGITADQLNYLRKTYPKVIWVFISQVKENGSMYGGNKMAHNPTAIIECHPSHDPKERYATLEKNRGNDLSICYDIYKQRAFVWKEVKKKQGDEEHINQVRKYL